VVLFGENLGLLVHGVGAARWVEEMRGARRESTQWVFLFWLLHTGSLPRLT
jgi:hypothetical protein